MLISKFEFYKNIQIFVTYRATLQWSRGPEEAVRQCTMKRVQRRQRDGIHRCKGNDDELDIYMTKDFHDIKEF